MSRTSKLISYVLIIISITKSSFYVYGLSKFKTNNVLRNSISFIKSRNDVSTMTRYVVQQMSARESVDKDSVKFNWNFLDDVFLITTTAKENLRLQKTEEELESVDLFKKVKIRTFKPDDEDRVRGCYSSHIEVLKEIKKQYNNKKSYQVLVLEDNLEKTLQISPEIVNSVNNFLMYANENSLSWDVFHLAYMMYVPNLSVAKLTESQGGNENWAKSIVQLYAGTGSSIGTSAYIISKSGVDAILNQHQKNGYKEAIPNIMASLFPNTRFAAYPMVFHRAAKIGSLVNPQLDSFRKVMFSPFIYSIWEKLLVLSKLQTNQLFPLLLISLSLAVLSSIYSFVTSILSSNVNDIHFDPLVLLLTLGPLGIALWGAELFTTQKGFAPSAQKK